MSGIVLVKGFFNKKLKTFFREYAPNTGNRKRLYNVGAGVTNKCFLNDKSFVKTCDMMNR